MTAVDLSPLGGFLPAETVERLAEWEPETALVVNVTDQTTRERTVILSGRTAGGKSYLGTHTEAATSLARLDDKTAASIARSLGQGTDVASTELYVWSIERTIRLCDRIIGRAVDGDPLAMLDEVGDYLNGVDAVDDESVVRFDRAKAALRDRLRIPPVGVDEDDS